MSVSSFCGRVTSGAVRNYALILLSFLIGALLHAQESIRLGDEFQVNSYTTGNQLRPSVAADAQGNFVVVWQSRGSPGTDASDYSIQAQRYDSDGRPVGGQFQVNSYTTSVQRIPSVGIDPQGNFAVVWESYGSYGSDASYHSIQAQQYDANGDPVGGQFQVNSYTTGNQWRSAVAMDAQGSFMVVWTSWGSFGTDSSLESIQAQYYDSSGTPVRGQFQVNSYTSYNQVQPAVAADGQGDFVTVWSSWGSYGNGTSFWNVQGQRLTGSGLALGREFQINSFSEDIQTGPRVAAGANGSFVVVWQTDGESPGTDSSFSSVQGQRFDASGRALGSQFQINSYTTNRQEEAAVALDTEGNYVVAWASLGSDGTDTSSWSVQGQRFTSNGSPLGDEFQVNSYTSIYQRRPVLAVGPNGTFVVVWESYGSYGTDTSQASIQAQLFATSIFADGFESGDTSAWDDTVP